MSTLRAHLKAFAKLNLFLNIKGIRHDGYHEIDSLFQTVDLADDVIISGSDSGSDEVTFKDYKINPRSNTVASALSLLRQKLSQYSVDFPPVKIEVTKNIKPGTGLGGGSSNAAAVISFFQKQFSDYLTQQDIYEIALKIGSDVPFFLFGGLCRVRGRGEIVEKTHYQISKSFIIAVPEESVSTSNAYKLWDEFGRLYDKNSDEALAAINEGRYEKGILLFNSFEDVIVRRYESIKETFKIMEKYELVPCLSGSGSAVFAVVEKDFIPDKDFIFELEEKKINIYIAKPTDQGAMELS